jgi:hypothetical protein
METINVQIRFTEEVPNHPPFSDALYYPYDKFDIDAKREEIEQEKKTRKDNWVYLLEHPVEPPEPTKEELEAEVASLEAQKLSLESMITEKQAQITAKTVKG